MQVIDVSKLVEIPVPTDISSLPDRVFVDRANGVCIQVWERATPGCDGTPWKGTLRIAIKHTAAKSHEEYESRAFSKPITWDDMQAIKDRYWPDRIGIEVFPPQSRIVNEADMRWMWILPKGASLPFNLQGHCNVLQS